MRTLHHRLIKLPLTICTIFAATCSRSLIFVAKTAEWVIEDVAVGLASMMITFNFMRSLSNSNGSFILAAANCIAILFGRIAVVFV